MRDSNLNRWFGQFIRLRLYWQPDVPEQWLAQSARIVWRSGQLLRVLEQRSSRPSSHGALRQHARSEVSLFFSCCRCFPFFYSRSALSAFRQLFGREFFICFLNCVTIWVIFASAYFKIRLLQSKKLSWKTRQSIQWLYS